MFLVHLRSTRLPTEVLKRMVTERPELSAGRVDPRVGLDRVGSGRVMNISINGGSGRVQILVGRVGSGPSTRT